MKKILITGAPGFAASHLIKEILSHGNGDVEIHGTKRVRSDMYRLEAMGLMDSVTNHLHLHLIEMTDAISVQNVIAEVMPDEIYHLAAQDYVKSSWDSPNETFNTNVNGTINLFEAIRRCYPRRIQGDPILINNLRATDQYQILEYPKVLITSTSETYGYYKEAINEETEQRPNNPYGISKMAQDHLARLYSRSYSIPIVVTRSFNITGWGRNDPFVDSNFARQIVEIEKGKRTVINHGNLQARRSFFDVQDAVRGYWTAMQYEAKMEMTSEEPSCKIFCFGPKQSTSIKELLGIMIGLSTSKIRTEFDPARSRPIDTPDMRCDAGKAKRMLGWEPTVSLKNSLEQLLEYWRMRIL